MTQVESFVVEGEVRDQVVVRLNWGLVVAIAFCLAFWVGVIAGIVALV